MSDVIEFRWDRWRLAAGAALFLAIGGGGVLLLLEPEFDVKVLGAVWLAVFVMGAAKMLLLRSDANPVVRVDLLGICDRRIKASVIPWQAIQRVEGFEAENVHFVGLDFYDPKGVLADARQIVRLTAPLHRLFRFPSVSLNMSLLDGSDADLLAAIARFAPALRQDGH